MSKLHTKLNGFQRELTEFWRSDDKEVQTNPEHDPFNRKLIDFDVFCPYCGAHGVKFIIRRGRRKTGRKGCVTRYFCKRCNRRFSKQKWGNQPLWVVTFVLEEILEGNTLKGTADKLRERNYKITRQTILNVVKLVVDAALKYEQTGKPKCKFREWQIDDTPQPFAETTSNGLTQPEQQQTRHKNKNKWWITNIVDVDSYYWFACTASKERESEASEKTIRDAIKRARASPLYWKCDGYPGHIRGIRNVLPHARIISVSKKKDIAVVNFIEGVVHGLLRSKAVKKRRKFRTLRTLQMYAELVRIWHNFLHKIHKLGNLTPAAKIGIAPIFRNWEDFIDYVFRRI